MLILLLYIRFLWACVNETILSFGRSTAAGERLCQLRDWGCSHTMTTKKGSKNKKIVIVKLKVYQCNASIKHVTFLDRKLIIWQKLYYCNIIWRFSVIKPYKLLILTVFLIENDWYQFSLIKNVICTIQKI